MSDDTEHDVKMIKYAKGLQQLNQWAASNEACFNCVQFTLVATAYFHIAQTEEDPLTCLTDMIAEIHRGNKPLH